jgi:hypothetical protein
MYSNLSDLKLKMQPWKPELKKVPHLTIETNMTCNFGCRNCYNTNRAHVKSLNEIYNEIETGLLKRKADTITLLGGEPTLHPDLEQIIRYIKHKAVVCQMLTNGFILSGPDGEELLAKLIAAGLDRILVHIDKGQEAYPDTYQAIHFLLKRLEKRRIFVSLSWTIYKNQQENLAGLIKEFCIYKNMDGVLSLLEKNVDDAIRSDYNGDGMPDMVTEYRSLSESLGLFPSIYIPSSTDDDDITWFIYFYYINSESLITFPISPWLTRAYMRTYLFIRGRELFGKTVMRSSFIPSLFITGLLESVANPRRIKEFFLLLKNSARTKQLRFHYLTIQDGPEFDKFKNRVSICYHCPDASVRNGRITPVCLADRINPFTDSSKHTPVQSDVAEAVYSHLLET